MDPPERRVHETVDKNLVRIDPDDRSLGRSRKCSGKGNALQDETNSH